MAISERKLKDGSTVYEIRVSRGRDPITGKQLTPYSMRYTPPEGYSAKRAYKEAQVVAAQFEADCRAGKVLTKAEQKAQAEREQREAAAHPTFKAYGEAWLKAFARDHAVSTVRAYTIAINRAGEVFNDLRLDEITPYMVKQYLSSLQGEGGNLRNGKKLAYKTYVKNYGILKCFFQSAEDSEIIERSPMAKIKHPKRPKDEPVKKHDVFSEQQVAYIFECMQQEPLKWQAVVAFMFDSGCRRGEVVGLMWSDIDFTTGKVTIQRNAQYTTGNGVYLTTPKTGRLRTIPISPRTLATLKQWKREQALYCLAHGIPNSGYCFTGDTGEMLHPQSLTDQFVVLGRKYNIPGFHPHALRHTMATLSIANGADVVSVSKRLGHADPSMTLDIYSHANEEAQQRASEIIANAIYKKA